MKNPIVHRYLGSMRIALQLLMVLSSYLRVSAFSSIARTRNSNSRPPLRQFGFLPSPIPTRKSYPSSIQLSMQSMSTKPAEDDDLDKWQRMYE